MACECNLAGLLQINYSGVFSASLNGSTEVALANDGTVLIGRTTNQLSISAWAFERGGDRYLGVQCPASASAEIRWLQKYDCSQDVTYFIPMSGGRASITGGPIAGVELECDPDIVSKSFNVSAQGSPLTPYITGEQRNGYNLVYIGHPINIRSASPEPYDIRIGDSIVEGYLQSFNLQASPPSPATVSYNFIVVGTII